MRDPLIEEGVSEAGSLMQIGEEINRAADYELSGTAGVRYMKFHQARHTFVMMSSSLLGPHLTQALESFGEKRESATRQFVRTWEQRAPDGSDRRHFWTHKAETFN